MKPCQALRAVERERKHIEIGYGRILRLRNDNDLPMGKADEFVYHIEEALHILDSIEADLKGQANAE